MKEMDKQEVNIREIKCLLEKLRTSADTKVFRGSASICLLEHKIFFGQLSPTGPDTNPL